MENGWSARLQLEYALHQGKTTLIGRRHSGPLQVQKALYPEGPGVCHTMVLHPPGGIAGGDHLDIKVDLAPGSHALITTPGAAKWYRSGGRQAHQNLLLTVSDGSALEWLPQETILFDGTQAQMQTHIDLHGGATYFGWEITRLGRTASGERYREGVWRQRTRISRNGANLWEEYGLLDGNDPLLDSPVGLAGHPVTATFQAVGKTIDEELLEACRKVPLTDSKNERSGITVFPELLVARYLGNSSEQARHYFTALWQLLRPGFNGVAACPPRIWNT